MLATSTQPGMFPVVSGNNPLTLVHTHPLPGSSTVSVQSLNTLPSTSNNDMVPVTIGEGVGIKKHFLCTYCNKAFGSRYNATRHEKGCKLAPPEMSQQNESSPVACPNCGKQFASQDGVNRHLKKKCKVRVLAFKLIY